MDHSTLQHHHHQEMTGSDESLDSMLVHQKATTEEEAQAQQVEQHDEKKPRPPDEVQKCPRCDSTNTKFCYYNNYSLSQPRYFCKSCRRYWTKGGTLRNVPVGGGCRKNRRSSASSSSSSSSSRRCTPDHHIMISTTNHASSSSSPPRLLSPYDNLQHQQYQQYHALSTNDLTLAFARLQKQGGGFDHHGNFPIFGNSHFDLFGNSFIDPQSNASSTSTLQHLYYGGGLGGDVEHNEGSIVNQHQQMTAMQFDHAHYQQNNQEMMSNPSSGSSTPTTIKQERGENKVQWGLPWQISSNGGDGNYMNAAVAIAGGGSGDGNEFGVSLKESWNNVGHVLNPTNWHNSLLNSPLM